MAAAVDAGDDRVPVEVDRRAQRQARQPGVAPAADHRRAAVVLVAQHARRWDASSRRATSAVTCSNTALGGASLATSVAMRRRAACSSARARVASSLATRRCSASRDWVTSLIVETTPSGRPPASRTGAELIQTQAGVPSGRVRRAVSGACGSPVVSASSPSSRPPETGRSSASTAAPRTSSGRRPRSRSRARPTICSAAALQSVMIPRRVTDDEALRHRLHDRAQSLLVGAQRLVGSRRARPSPRRARAPSAPRWPGTAGSTAGCR